MSTEGAGGTVRREGKAFYRGNTTQLDIFPEGDFTSLSSYSGPYHAISSMTRTLGRDPGNARQTCGV
jgi:hypothetical protein